MKSREADGGGKLFLESVLRCRVLQYTCVRNSPSFAYKVRINENELQGHLAVLWTCGVRTGWGTLEVLPSVPFLNALIEEDSKVIVVSEH